MHTEIMDNTFDPGTEVKVEDMLFMNPIGAIIILCTASRFY